LNGNKLKNVPTGNQTAPATPASSGLSLAAKEFSFKAWTPAPADPIKENLAKHGIKDEEEVKSIKAFLEELKKSVKESKDGVIDLEMFKKVGTLKICQSQEAKVTDECLKNSVNAALLDREVKEVVEGMTKMKKNYSHNNKPGKGGYNNQYGDDFAKGTAGKGKYGNQGGMWKQEDNQEKAKLREQAQANYTKIKSDKNDTQKIKLILNVIAPDNFEKKFGELRGFLFKGLKTKEECEEEEIEYIEDIHKLKEDSDQLDQNVLDTIVQNIFRKAQLEKEYTIFYGELCEKKIKLELQLRDMQANRQNMKNSLFRKTLFDVCKQCFEKFFDSEERTKQTSNPETAILFKTKLFGNIDFVGELYRRKLLPHATLNNVFMSLLGIDEMKTEIDDLVIEGAINLMNKVGGSFEESAKASKKKEKDDQNNKVFYDNIMNRFTEIMNYPDERLISNRIKILIKNMFSNKEDGWAKSAEINKGGPKKKIEIQQEVENKYKQEQ
jgi:hypothetical protein